MVILLFINIDIVIVHIEIVIDKWIILRYRWLDLIGSKVHIINQL